MKGVLNQGNTLVEHILPRALDPLYSVPPPVSWLENERRTHTPSFIGEKVKRYLACTVIVGYSKLCEIRKC